MPASGMPLLSASIFPFATFLAWPGTVVAANAGSANTNDTRSASAIAPVIHVRELIVCIVLLIIIPANAAIMPHILPFLYFPHPQFRIEVFYLPVRSLVRRRAKH